MWGTRHLAMLATIRVGEPSRALVRYWPSVNNSKGSLREFAANRISLPGMYKISRANKAFSSLSPQMGFASEAILCDVILTIPFVTLTCPS